MTYVKFFSKIQSACQILVNLLNCKNCKVMKRLSELVEHDLYRSVKVSLGFEQVETGILTDFYGSLDNDNRAVIAIELDEQITFFLAPNTLIEFRPN